MLKYFYYSPLSKNVYNLKLSHILHNYASFKTWKGNYSQCSWHIILSLCLFGSPICLRLLASRHLAFLWVFSIQCNSLPGFIIYMCWKDEWINKWFYIGMDKRMYERISILRIVRRLTSRLSMKGDLENFLSLWRNQSMSLLIQ